MMCKIDGCDRDAMYKGQQVCQKHYFRFMRYGTYSLKGPKKVYLDRRGYVKLRKPGHPLADSAGIVWLHRYVLFSEYGENIPPCELCGKAESWGTCHVDHIDHNPSNNKRGNLRILCVGCNTSRHGERKYSNEKYVVITHGDKTMTAHEWSLLPDVPVCGATIRRRIRRGMPAYEAIYSPSKTYKGQALRI